MITHLKARLFASAVTLLVVLHPGSGHGQAAHAPAPTPANSTPAYRVDPVVTQTPRISVVTTGKGPAIVLIPGLSSPRAVWDGVVPELARTHRVHIVQVNGFGGEDARGNTAPGILEGIVADLDGYIARQKIGPVAVVGHSMGGLVTLMLARAHPGDVAKAMIVDSLPFVGEIFVPGATVAMVEPRAKAMRDAMIASYGKPADPAIARGTANGLALKPASRAAVAAWFAKADPRVSGQAMYEDLTTDLRPDMARIATPITVVYPWNDMGPTKAAADALYRRAYAGAPKVDFVDIGDAAHFVMLDQPEAFRAAVTAFAK